MNGPIFVAATNNKGKLAEIKKVFESLGLDILSMEEAGISCEPDESGKSFYENALIKATAAAALTEYPVVADDSGLMVEALGGLPGVRSARYAGAGCSDRDNIDKLLEALEGLPAGDRRAWFAAAAVAVLPGGEIASAHGYAAGSIGFEARGEGGFGYDPVFLSDGVSFSELLNERKNAVSHRGRALRKLGFKLRGIKRMRKIT